MSRHDEQLRALEDRIAQLGSEVAALRAGESDPQDSPDRTERTAVVAPAETHGLVPEARTDRRALLRRMGIAAAGAAAGGTALGLSSASPAAAANGDAIVLGEQKGFSAKTSIWWTTSGVVADNLFEVRDSWSGMTEPYPSSIAGVASIHSRHGVAGKAGGAGYGIVGIGSGPYSTGGSFNGRKANLRLLAEGVPPAERTTTVDHAAGDVVNDEKHDLWLCVGPGSTGAAASWRKLGGPSSAGQLHVVGPKRCYDSRPEMAPAGGTKGKMSISSYRTVDVTANATGVPVGARAVMVNLVVVDTNSSGLLAAFRSGVYPGTTTVAWDTGTSSIANMALVGLDANAAFKVFCTGAGGAACHFAVDVLGYYR